MDIQYADINELLQSDDAAYELFNSLPDYIQELLLDNGGEINNYDELMLKANSAERKSAKNTTN